VTSTHANLGLAGPGLDRAYAFSFEGVEGCRSSRAFVGVASGGKAVLAASAEPVRCHRHCRVVAAPDVNGDGVAEIAVGQRGFATFFSLFRVGHGSHVTVAPLSKSGGRVLEFAVGGSTQSMWGLICDAGSMLTSWGAGETQEGAGPYDVHVTTYQLRRSVLIRLSGRHRMVPQGHPSRLPQNGGAAFGASNGICGAHLLPQR
jgi:hypothetical protein